MNSFGAMKEKSGYKLYRITIFLFRAWQRVNNRLILGLILHFIQLRILDEMRHFDEMNVLDEMKTYYIVIIHNILHQGSKSAKFFSERWSGTRKKQWSGEERWSGPVEKIWSGKIFMNFYAKNCSKGTETLTHYSWRSNMVFKHIFEKYKMQTRY